MRCIPLRKQLIKKPINEVVKVAKDTISLYGELLKVIIPVMILVRIAVGLGAIDAIGVVIEPVMGWVGLPGEMGDWLAYLMMLLGLLAALFVLISFMKF